MIVSSWQCGRFILDMSQPKIMAIVNITNSSFSGDGVYADNHDWVKNALNYAQKQKEAGADILDIGAESSRPGSVPISASLEWQRLSQILPELLSWDIAISVDTNKPIVMAAALDLGVDIINDINGFRSEDKAGKAWSVMAKYNAGAVVMHMQGSSLDMQKAPYYDDVVSNVQDFFGLQFDIAIKSGVLPECLAFDLGFGFGKTLAHNVSLFKAISKLSKLYAPLVVGVSRKSMIGEITGLPVEQRLTPSVMAALMAIQNGATVVRVHDVTETIAALAIQLRLSTNLE